MVVYQGRIVCFNNVMCCCVTGATPSGWNHRSLLS